MKSVATVNSYIAVRDEITELEASSTKYDIEVSHNFSLNSAGKGGGRYIKELQRVSIVVCGEKEYGWLAHELKHAYQFETGKFSILDKDDYRSRKNTFYDREDEIEAFERGMMFDNSLPSYFQVADSYDGLQYGPEQADPKATDAELQKIANENGIIFKVNGKLYTPNKK